eukprot:516873_1
MLEDDCDSKSRKKVRIERFKTKFTEEEYNFHSHDDSIFRIKEVDIFELKQRYYQNNLDVIHYFLVHQNVKQTMKSSDYKNLYVSKKTNASRLQAKYPELFTTKIIDDAYYHPDKRTQINTEKEELFIIQANAHKYVTEIINNNDTKAAEYGFGVDHSYPHIEPRKNTNMRSELLFNSVCKLRTVDFEDLLMRALKMQRIAVNEKKMRCKHYETEYNIVRNEPIGIRHLLSIILYADMTAFCTA